MQCALFAEDLASLNYMQLADWLAACRSFIQRENCDTYKEYLDMVAAFCGEWENHYQQHKKQYESEKFKKALCYILFQQRLNCYIDFANGKEPIDVSYNMLQQSVFSNKVKPLIDEVDQIFSTSYSNIQKIFENKERYKERLHKVVLGQIFNDTSIRVRAFTDGGKWIKSASYQEFIDNCEKQKYYFECDAARTTKRSYAAAFQRYDVTTSVYQDFIDENKQEREFDKKLFVNMAFMLALNATNAETLLKWNGYTMKDSTRQFDAICRKAFQIGFSREYMIALIDKYNAELEARCKATGKEYDTIQNITKNRRQKAAIV